MCSINYGRKRLRILQWRHSERDGLSPASPLFAQPFVQAKIRRKHKAPRRWPLWGDSTGDLWIPLMDSSYRGPVTRKMFPFDDIILLCVFTLGTETFSGYVRYRNEQCHLSHDRELIFVTSVKNVPKCLTLSTLGTHLVVFMSVIVHASHWYQAHNIMREIRSKAKAILPSNIQLIPDGTKTNSVGSSISILYQFFFQILV